MIWLEANALEKEFDGRPVLRGGSFQIADGERVALVGANGCGKSTLLQILAGRVMPDRGTVRTVKPALRVALLEQEGQFDWERPLGDQLPGVPTALLSRLGVTATLRERPAGMVSGGQRVRAALARALASVPDLLLLDEPTNHLDQEGLTWLEEAVRSYRGTVVIVSHDRHFLDRVATRTLELAEGRLFSYAGGWSVYWAAKAAERRAHEEAYGTYQKKRRQLEEALRAQQERARAGHNVKVPRDANPAAKAFYAGKGKAAARQARAIERRIGAMIVEKPRQADRVRARWDDAERGARWLFRGADVGHSYDGQHWLFRKARFAIGRGERIALVGPNGSGKSTMLNLLLGAFPPTEGRVDRAHARIAYLDQEVERLPQHLSVLAAATGNAAADQSEARTILGGFLFSGDDVLRVVASLSGGEKVRLALARILLRRPDVLVLDEPTNHLDLLVRERIEEALEAFAGTILFATHDRYLLKRLATGILALGDGRLTMFDGGYDAFCQRQATPPGRDDLEERRLLLEIRLSQLSAALTAPKPEEKAQLDAEFIRVSRELRDVRLQLAAGR